MFACELNESLVNALKDLSNNIPELLPTIRERLLNILSVTLLGHPYVHPGAPKQYQSIANYNTQQNEELIIVALKTLGSFSFKGLQLQEMILDLSKLYLVSDNVMIRQACCYTCSFLLKEDPVCDRTSDNSLQICSDVLERLIAIGVADPGMLI